MATLKKRVTSRKKKGGLKRTRSSSRRLDRRKPAVVKSPEEAKALRKQLRIENLQIQLTNLSDEINRCAGEIMEVEHALTTALETIEEMSNELYSTAEELEALDFTDLDED